MFFVVVVLRARHDLNKIAPCGMIKVFELKLNIKIVFLILYFIKSQTSDSFVNHFDGHFAYLKTLDFFFKKIFVMAFSDMTPAKFNM